MKISNIDTLLFNTSFIEINGVMCRKRKAYIKWIYLDPSEYPSEFKGQITRSPKKVRQKATCGESPKRVRDVSNSESPRNDGVYVLEK